MADDRQKKWHTAIWRSFEDGSDPVANAMAEADAECQEMANATVIFNAGLMQENERLRDLYDGAQRMIPGFQQEINRLTSENVHLFAELKDSEEEVERQYRDCATAEATIKRAEAFLDDAHSSLSPYMVRQLRAILERSKND